MRIRRQTAALLTFVAAACVGCGSSSQIASEPAAVAPAIDGRPAGVPGGSQPAWVDRIVDGDTIWVVTDQPGPLAGGIRHKIRLLEIDTPEVQSRHRVAECGGSEATRFAQRELPVGSVVYLVADREDVDQYGRFLRYLWNARGDFYNEKVVAEGIARAVLFQPNDRYIAQLREVEAEARTSGKGIWGPPCKLGY